MERLRRTSSQITRDVDLREQEQGGKEAPDAVVRHSKQESVCEMRQKQPEHKGYKGRCAGPQCLTVDSKHQLGRWGKSHLGGQDMVRRVDGHGEASIWCRKCSGYAGQRMGLKLMNCCKPQKMDTKAQGKMISSLRRRRSLLRGWATRAMRRVTRKEYQRLREE